MQRPNILLFYTDQQRWDTLGVNGNSHIITPNLDCIARSGSTFTHHFVQHPLCMPSRVSMLSGQYPSTLGITHMGVPVPMELLTLPHLFKQYGYTVANIGKLHFIPHANRDHREPHPDYDMTHTAFVADQTQAFLRKQDNDQPFLCIAGFYSQHAPWIVPQGFLDMYDRESLPLPDYLPDVDAQRPHNADEKFSDAQLRSAKHGYYAMITEVDYYIGQIVETLHEQRLVDNTIIIFTSDHGEWLGDQLRYGKGYPADDAVSRVPLVICAPDASEGQVIDSIVESVDIVPTLLDLAGIQIPPTLQGKSLAPMLCGRHGDNLENWCALTESVGWKTLRTPDYRYLVHDDGSECLWDMVNDPNGYHDLTDKPEYASELARCRHLLLQRLLKIERPRKRTYLLSSG